MLLYPFLTHDIRQIRHAAVWQDSLHASHGFKALAQCIKLAFAFWLAMALVPAIAQDKPPACGDFLQIIGKKPVHLEFIGCQPGKQAQVRVLQAEYRVQGKYAARVERFLVKHARMPPLKKVCCIWDNSGGRYGRFKSGYQFVAGDEFKRAFDYMVWMNLGESVASIRAATGPRLTGFT